MRSLASADAGAGAARFASASPDGGETEPPPRSAAAPKPAATATSAIAAPAARAIDLAERVTRVAVEEMHAGHVDRDRHVLGDAQHDVRRVLRDEVRPRPDDPAFADRRVLLLLLLVLL